MNDVKLLFYAINGSGLGHLSRLLAVARSARELLKALGLKDDFRFLTTSEASEIAWDFPVYKLPSKTIAREAGLDKGSFETSCKMMVSSLIGTLAPQLLVVDTQPEGSYREMSFLRSFVPLAAYIDRHKDSSVSESELHQRHVVLYDRVLVPDYPEAADRYPIPPQVRSRRRFVGPIHGYVAERALTREQVREQFGVAPGRRLIYLSGGGGSDSRDLLEEVALKLARDPDNQILIGYGPLHRSDCLYGDNIIPLTSAEVRRYFAGLDLAVSAGGYNSFQELLAAAVPTVFYAQEKGMDRQDERIRLGAEQGWHLTAAPESESILARVQELLEGPKRGQLLQNLAGRPRARGALLAAAELLTLHSSLPDSPVNRQKLAQVAGWRLHYESPEDFPAVALLARRWRKLCCSRAALDEAAETATHRWRSGEGQVDEVLALARRLLPFEEELQSELMRAWCHGQALDLEQEAGARERLLDTLNILEEHFCERLPAVLSEVLDQFHRPNQREALYELAARLDSDDRPGLAAELRQRLRREQGKLGIRGLALFRADGRTPQDPDKRHHLSDEKNRKREVTL